jgi:hypothetical protein
VRIPVGGRREAECPAEARGERAEAPEPDGGADLGDRAVGVAEQRRRSFEPAGQQVLVRGLAEGAPELTAEVRGGEARRACQRRDVERLAVARVDQVLRAKQVTCGRCDDDGAAPLFVSRLDRPAP